MQVRIFTLPFDPEVEGFGKKGIQKYGKQIIEIIKGFYETEPAAKEQAEALPPATDAAAAEQSDVPY